MRARAVRVTLAAAAPYSDQLHQTTLLADPPILLVAVLNRMGLVSSDAQPALGNLVRGFTYSGASILVVVVCCQWFFLFQNF